MQTFKITTMNAKINNISRKIRQTALIILASLALNSAYALATNIYETVANGNWTNTSIWKNGKAPGTNVNGLCVITVNHAVTMNSNVTLNAYVELEISKGASLKSTYYKLTLNSATLTNVGTINIKNLENNSGTIKNGGTLTVSNSTSNNSGVISSEGIMSLGKFLNNNGELYSYKEVSFSNNSQNNDKKSIIEATGLISIGNSFSLNDGSVSLDGKISIGTYVNLNCGTMDLKGDVSINGTLTISGTNLTNYANTTISSTFTFNSGKIINYGTITLNRKAYIYQNASIVTYGTFFFKSTLTNYSTNISIETTDTNTGNFSTLSTVTGEKQITLKRHITHSGWHYISSPLSDAKSNVFKGAALYSYDESQAKWIPLKSGESLVAGKGYDVYYKDKNQVISFTGSMNTGTVSCNLTKTMSAGMGYNLVGNPYPSAIDWDATSGWTRTNVSNAFYIWDMKTNNIAAYVNGVGTNGATSIIPATSAFFVLCTSTSGGSLKMTDAVKVNKNPNFREASSENIIRVKLSNGIRFDETVIRFDELATSKYDDEFDAEKMYSFDASTPQIYSFSDENIDMAISTMNIGTEPVNVQLGYIANVEGNFSLSFNFNNFDPNINVYLEDTELGIIHDLHTGDYLFQTSTGVNNSRFILHFVPLQTVSNNDTNNFGTNFLTSVADNNTHNNANVFASGKKIYVHTSDENSVVKVYNVAGQEVVSVSFAGTGLNSIDMQNYHGVFVVKYMSGELMNSVKVMIE